MKAVFRADASLEMGSGHVMRCLTLADALVQKSVDCHFVTRPLPGHLIDTILARGHNVTALNRPTAAGTSGSDLYGTWLAVTRQMDAAECAGHFLRLAPDLVIIDHYALDLKWESQTLPAQALTMVCDDLATRSHNCDILLDQNLGRTEADYDGLVPDHTHRMIGPAYALLRPEFADLRPVALGRRRSGAVRHLLISMGGVDKDNATGEILSCLSEMPFDTDFRISVVMGEAAPHLNDLRAQAADMDVQVDVLSNVKHMPSLMTQADVAIGGAGGTAWERCCLGLPTLLLTIADNQVPSARALAQAGAASYVGDVRTTGWQDALNAALKRCIMDPDWNHSLSCAASEVCDGFGTARVADELMARLSRKHR